MALENGSVKYDTMDEQIADLKEEVNPLEEVPNSAAGPGGDGAGAPEEDDEDDRKLFVGALNWEVTRDQMKEYFQKFGDVTEVILKEDYNGRPRGFGFVTFKDAASREKCLAKDNHQLHGKNIDPKKVLPRIYKIFVGALDPTLKEEEIKEHFSQFGEILEIELPYNKAKNERRAFAFIRFKQEEAVNKALAAPKIKLGDREIEIKKALPNQKGPMGYGNPRGGFRGRPRGGWGYGQGFFQPGGYSGYGHGYGGYGPSGYQAYGNYDHYSGWGDYQHGGGGYGGSAGWV